MLTIFGISPTKRLKLTHKRLVLFQVDYLKPFASYFIKFKSSKRKINWIGNIKDDSDITGKPSTMRLNFVDFIAFKKSFGSYSRKGM